MEPVMRKNVVHLWNQGDAMLYQVNGMAGACLRGYEDCDENMRPHVTLPNGSVLQLPDGSVWAVEDLRWVRRSQEADLCCS